MKFIHDMNVKMKLILAVASVPVLFVLAVAMTGNQAHLTSQMLGELVFATVAGLALAISIAVHLARSLDHAKSAMEGIASGNLDVQVKTDSQDETGQLLEALDKMRAHLLERQIQERKRADDNLRVKRALDGCTTNVMIADNDLNIVYMNESVQTMLKTAEADLRKELPNFNASKLMGESIDSFHKNPAHQRGMLKALNTTFRTQIVVGGRTFGLIANPVLSDSGERIGSVVEWADRTAEVLAEKEAEARMIREKQISEDNLRVKRALDGCTTNVMIADNDLNIVYMNESVSAMLKVAESDLRKELPNFNASKLLGESIDSFHKNPAHQRGMLKSLNSTYRTKIVVGGRTFGLIANPVLSDSGERIGSVVEWADRTAEVQAENEAAERMIRDKQIAEENLRVKRALDGCTTNVMIADNDLNIVYMNDSVQAMLKVAESDLRKELPNFNASKLMGESIDSFHKNPAHQRGMLKALNATFRTQIVVGARTFGLIANPVLSDSGERIGSVVEWNDRTAEVEAEKEVNRIVQGAALGDFSTRMDLNGKTGFFRQLSEGMNKLLETSETGLNEVVRMLSALSRGDLTDKITNEYAGTFGKLKDDANATADNLKEIVMQIKEATDTINTASKEIAVGNSDLSQRTEEQASSLEETASSMEELTSTVKQNAENAKQANQLAKGASDIALKGGDVVGKVVETMSSINDSSRKIVDIISVIDGIAFQTNILALNAAVEAARAGEQGRGFAVVAAEVRNLAQRSAAAAKEIKTLIGDSVEKVEGGTKLVDEAGKTMEEIVTAVKRVTDIMSEISAASMEQSSGIEQVNQAITQMDEVTQQNAALVEEAAAAAESLEEQAQNLMESVSIFKLADSGSGAMHAKRVAAPAHKSTPAISAPVAKPVRTAGAKPKSNASSDESWEEF